MMFFDRRERKLTKKGKFQRDDTNARLSRVQKKDHSLLLLLASCCIINQNKESRKSVTLKSFFLLLGVVESLSGFASVCGTGSGGASDSSNSSSAAATAGSVCAFAELPPSSPAP